MWILTTSMVTLQLWATRSAAFFWLSIIAFGGTFNTVQDNFNSHNICKLESGGFDSHPLYYREVKRPKNCERQWKGFKNFYKMHFVNFKFLLVLNVMERYFDWIKNSVLGRSCSHGKFRCCIRQWNYIEIKRLTYITIKI